MSETTPFARTRGGLLVALIVGGVIGFEIRTAMGMFFGIDLPLAPYLIAVILVLIVFAVLADSLGKIPERRKQGE